MSCPACHDIPSATRGNRTKWYVAFAVGVVIAVLAAEWWRDAEPELENGRFIDASGRSSVRFEVGQEGFSPSSVRVPAGQALQLQFNRTSDQSCATSVVVPEAGVRAELPLNALVSLQLPAGHERTLTLQCGVADQRGAAVLQ